MAATPKPTKKKSPSNKKNRTHLPSLDPAKLEETIAQVKAAKLSAASKRAVIESLRAAANPDTESPSTVICSLPDERRESVEYQ